jgi:hypothetical protein
MDEYVVSTGSECSKAGLWMPVGSVRALIVLSLVVGVVLLAAFGKPIPGELATALGLGIREYFSARGNG